MNLFYSPDIHFMIENVSFSVSNIAREQFMTPVPRHVHGNGSYEFHYIASGYGTARINGSIYKLVPGTLYVTGPQVEHEQIPYLDNPMTEYAVFFVIQKETVDLSCVDQFLETPFWMGENASAIHDLLQIVFEELQDKQAGYLTQVSALLQQMVIYLIRNYQIPRPGNIAGMRTGNLYAPYPEEFNRRAVAVLARYHFAPTSGAAENLLREGIEKAQIYVTGNTAIDALKVTVNGSFSHPVLERLAGRRMLLMTAHRRENLGEPLHRIFSAVRTLCDRHPEIVLVYPVHPNPAVQTAAHKAFDGCPNAVLTEPLDAVAFHNAGLCCRAFRHGFADNRRKSKCAKYCKQTCVNQNRKQVIKTGAC